MQQCHISRRSGAAKGDAGDEVDEEYAIDEGDEGDDGSDGEGERHSHNVTLGNRR